MDKYHEKQLQGVEEGGHIYLDSLNAAHRKIPNWKTADNDVMHEKKKKSRPTTSDWKATE